MTQAPIINQFQFSYDLIGDLQEPAIVLLHGFMGDRRDFSAIVPHLRGFCCLVIDLPDHGQTQVSSNHHYQMDDVAKGIIGLLEELAIEQCWLVGYSMGGRIALYLAIYFPQYFQGVILESASPGLKTQAERDRRIARDNELARRLESKDFTQFVQQWYANPLFESFTQHPNFPQAIARRLDNAPDKLARSLRSIGLGMQPSLWHLLPQVQPPLSLIVGALDPKFVAIARQLVKMCPQANLNVVKNTGHNVHYEQPKKFVESIRYFIERSYRSTDHD